MQLETIIQDLDKFMLTLDSIDYEHDRSGFLEEMLNVRKFAASKVDENVVSELMLSSGYESYKCFFQEANERYLKGIEKAEVERLISSNQSSLDQLHIRQSYLGKQEEITMLDLSKVNSIVIVGAGAFSETALYCHNQTAIERIIVIDNDESAVESGIELAKHLTLDRLEWVHMNAQEYDYSDVDAIYLTGFSFPKNEVLKRVNETSNQGVMVLIENCTHQLQKLFFEDFDVNESHFRSVQMKTITHQYCYRTVTCFEKVAAR